MAFSSLLRSLGWGTGSSDGADTNEVGTPREGLRRVSKSRPRSTLKLWATKQALPTDLAESVWFFASAPAFGEVFRASPLLGAYFLRLVGRPGSAGEALILTRERIPDREETEPGMCCCLGSPDAEGVSKELGASLGSLRQHTDKRQLGRLLAGELIRSCGNEDCLWSLREGFFSQICDEGVPLVSALREALSRFRLPGSSKQTQDVMWAFAEAWYDRNKEADVSLNPFVNVESTYIFVYALIMLSSDRTSGSKWRMECNQFVQNVSGTNGGGDLPVDFIVQAYREVDALPLTPRKHST